MTILADRTVAAVELPVLDSVTEPRRGRRALPGVRGRSLHLLPWVLVPLFVGMAYLALPSPSNLRSGYQGAAVALTCAPALAFLLTRTTRWAHHTAAALAAAVLPALSLISLHGTGWFFSGPFGDQSSGWSTPPTSPPTWAACRTTPIAGPPRSTLPAGSGSSAWSRG